MRLPKLTFSRRIFLLFLVSIVIPMVLIFWFSYQHVGEQLDEQNFRRLHQQVRSTSLSIYERLLFLKAELILLSSRLPDEMISSGRFSDDGIYVFEDSVYERFSCIFFQNAAITIPIYGKPRGRLQLSEINIEMLRNEKTVLMDQDMGGKFPTLFMIVPVVANSPDKGVIWGEISPEYLWGIGSMYTLPPMTDLFVIDPNRRLLIASGDYHDVSLDCITGAGSDDTIQRTNWSYGGEDHVVVCRKLFIEGQFSVPGWTIVLSRSENDIRRSLENFNLVFSLLFILALLVVLLISAISIRRSLKPLLELRSATRTIASGNFDTKLEISSGDEFEELADDFNQMGEKLHRQFKELRLNAEIGRHMASSLDAQKIANGVLKSICRYLDFDAGFLGWGCAESGIFEETGSYGINQKHHQELIRHCQFLLKMQNPSIENEQEPIFIAMPSLAQIVGADSGIYRPLRFAHPLSGIVIVFKKRAGLLSENTKKRLSSIVDELSVCLSNIYYHNRFLESEKKFRSIFENSAAGIALLDIHGRFIKANPSLCRMLGYSEAELLTKTSEELLSDEDRSKVIRIYQELQDGKRDAGFLEERYIHKDGQTIWAVVGHSLLRNQAGQPAYYIDLAQDISELKQVREKNKTLEKHLQQAQKMEALGTLAGGIAHDFNNILMAIMGFSELALLEVQASDPCHAKITQVLKAASRASDLVKQILTFSRQDLLEKQKINFICLVKESLKLIRATFPANIKIEEDYENKRATVMADPTQIHQLVMNLCANAYYAMKEKETGILRLEIRSAKLPPSHLLQSPLDNNNGGLWLRFSVSDNGWGILPQDLDRIFEPYFTTKPMGEGTGLGLAVVHGIMTKLGGYIDVQSRQGEGTRFDLFFPVYQETDESEKPQSTVVVSGEERVMFVDDEPYLVEIGQKMLEKLGYRVETFMDPLEALEAFRKDPYAYDLVITDKSMPHMNGQNLAVALRAIRPDLPIVISSGYHDKKNPETGSNLSRRIIYIDKPLRYADLAKVIREILD